MEPGLGAKQLCELRVRGVGVNTEELLQLRQLDGLDQGLRTVVVRVVELQLSAFLAPQPPPNRGDADPEALRDLHLRPLTAPVGAHNPLSKIQGECLAHG